MPIKGFATSFGGMLLMRNLANSTNYQYYDTLLRAGHGNANGGWGGVMKMRILAGEGVFMAMQILIRPSTPEIFICYTGVDFCCYLDPLSAKNKLSLLF